MNDPAVVRRATPADAQRISELTQSIQALHTTALPNVFKPADANTFSVAAVQHLLALTESVFLVAIRADRIAGYLYAEVQHVPESAIRYASQRVLIHHMVVDVTAQRQGIGTGLLAAIRRIAQTMQIPTLVLDVWDFNQDAQAFYRANGFRDTRHAMSLTIGAHLP